MPKLCLGGCVGLSKNSVEWRWRVGGTYHTGTHAAMEDGKNVLAVLLTEFGKSPIYQVIPKVLFHMGSTASATSKHHCFLLAYKKKRYLYHLTR